MVFGDHLGWLKSFGLVLVCAGASSLFRIPIPIPIPIRFRSRSDPDPDPDPDPFRAATAFIRAVTAIIRAATAITRARPAIITALLCSNQSLGLLSTPLEMLCADQLHTFPPGA